MNVCMPDSFTSFCCPLLISALTLVLLHKYEYGTFTSVFPVESYAVWKAVRSRSHVHGCVH